MREILFRGKRKDNGEWVYGAFSSCDFDGESGIICKPSIIDYDDNCLWCEVIPSTVGQYTGLHDATKWGELSEKEQREFLSNHRKEEWNGKKIFEGDIVKSCEYDDIYFIRYFGDDNYPAFDCVPDVPYGLSCLVNEEDCEIIGNIHDNPELLKYGL